MTPFCAVCGDNPRANCEFCVHQLREEVKETEHEEQPLTLEEIRQIRQELVDERYVEWSGEYRNGQKVWRVTDKGRCGDLPAVDSSPN